MAARYATKDEVLELVPGLADNAVLADLAQSTKVFVPIDTWGDSTFAGHWRLVAHYATVDAKNQGGSSGVVTSRAMGQISESYQQGSDEDLCRTEYGRFFLRLRGAVASAVSFSDGDRGWTLPDGRVI